jgi:hypothetical protein
MVNLSGFYTSKVPQLMQATQQGSTKACAQATTTDVLNVPGTDAVISPKRLRENHATAIMLQLLSSKELQRVSAPIGMQRLPSSPVPNSRLCQTSNASKNANSAALAFGNSADHVLQTN